MDAVYVVEGGEEGAGFVVSRRRSVRLGEKVGEYVRRAYCS